VDCLSEDDVVRFVTGGLSQTAISPIDLHIDSCRPCRLLVSVFASQTGDRPRSHESLCAFAVGDELAGRYTVRSLLGVGGMGEVYEVHDAVLGETVALKTIAVGSSLNADGVARFKAEAQMARRVTHPNVCRVFDVGFHSNARQGGARDQSPGIPFLTMELLRGETLRSRLKRMGAMTMVDAVLMIVQIAEGLAAAHEAGVTHGDLKSENVMLITDTKLGTRAVLTDFGLARQVDGRSLRLFDEDPTVAGTMGYMAPEQFRGQPASPECDVYALGVVFYELLTGRLPYDIKALLTGQVPSQWVPPPPPSLRQLGASVPASWDAIVATCLAVNPQRRFSSARAFIDALSAALPQGRRRRRRFVLAGGALLGASLILTLTLSRAGTPGSAEIAATGQSNARVSLAPAPPAPPPQPYPQPPSPPASPNLAEVSKAPSDRSTAATAPRRRAARRPSPAATQASVAAPASALPATPGKDDVVDPFAVH
jgi:serine/threonine protein kinase